MEYFKIKYLLRALPKELENGTRIFTTYLSLQDEVFIRKVREKHFLVCKRKYPDGSFVGDKIEITEDMFDILLSSVMGYPIEQTRYNLFTGKFMWEISEYHDNLAGLYIAQIVLPRDYIDVDIPLPPSIADLVIKNITENKRYTQKTLALEGFPRTNKKLKKYLRENYWYFLHDLKNPILVTCTLANDNEDPRLHVDYKGFCIIEAGYAQDWGIHFCFRTAKEKERARKIAQVQAVREMDAIAVAESPEWVRDLLRELPKAAGVLYFDGFVWDRKKDGF